MNVLFLTLLNFNSINERNIYTDLLREFIKHDHMVYAISPVEKRMGQETRIIKEEKATILKLKIGNVQKTNLLEKGVSTVTLESKFIKGIKKFFPKVKFDLILYSTPPITLQKAIAYVKRRDDAKTYLLLKDIFPQNAVDMGMMNKRGLKAPLYYYFRIKEKKLYTLSDRIGCMSQANIDFVLKNNLDVSPDIVEECPNSVEVVDMRIGLYEQEVMRKKYDIPLDKTVFIYGGNLGKPQGISYIIKCLTSQLENTRVYFLIVGDGTEFKKLKKFFEEVKPTNMKLLKRLPKDDYERMVAACDVGLIFLDYRFTIPNYPSRLLSYMQAGLPILACTDISTDIGKTIVEGGFGWWCESDNVDKFEEVMNEICISDLKQIGKIGYQYMLENYSVDRSYTVITKGLQ